VKNLDVGDSELAIQRWLANQAVVHLNDFLAQMYSYTTLYQASSIIGLMTRNAVSTFYTSVRPPPIWEQAVGGIAPLLGIAAAVLGPSAELARAVAALGAASSVVGIVTAPGTVDDLAPIQEQQFIQNGKIHQMLGNWVEAVSRGVQQVYDNTIGGNGTTSE